MEQIKEAAQRTAKDGLWVRDNIKVSAEHIIDSFKELKENQIYNELQDINNVKRKLKQDDQSMNTLKAVFSVRFTIFFTVIRDIQFWFSIGVYFVARWIEIDASAKTLPFQPVSFNAVGILGGLMSFLLVFYVGQSYSRFYAQYDVAMSIESRIFELVLLAREKLPNASAWQMYRYANVAQIVGYVGLSDCYNEDNFLRPINDYWKLLTPSELERLHILGVDAHGSAYREVISWIYQVVQSLIKDGVIPPAEYGIYTNTVLPLMKSLSTLYDYADQPLPFAYTQFVYFMSAIYLPYFAYTLANNLRLLDRTMPNELVGIVGVILNNTFVIGLRVLCKKLQQPFGNSFEDLSVFHYCHTTLRISAKIMNAQRIEKADSEIETAMNAGRPALGDGF